MPAVRRRNARVSCRRSRRCRAAGASVAGRAARDAFQGGVVQHDIGRHAALPRYPPSASGASAASKRGLLGVATGRRRRRRASRRAPLHFPATAGAMIRASSARAACTSVSPFSTPRASLRQLQRAKALRCRPGDGPCADHSWRRQRAIAFRSTSCRRRTPTACRVPTG